AADAPKEVVQDGEDLALQAGRNFFACLLRHEASSAVITVPTADGESVVQGNSMPAQARRLSRNRRRQILGSGRALVQRNERLLRARLVHAAIVRRELEKPP